MSTIALHSPLNMSEIVRVTGLVPKDHHGSYGMGYKWSRSDSRTCSRIMSTLYETTVFLTLREPTIAWCDTWDVGVVYKIQSDRTVKQESTDADKPARRESMPTMLQFDVKTSCRQVNDLFEVSAIWRVIVAFFSKIACFPHPALVWRNDAP